MADNDNNQDTQDGAVKDPENWSTGGEPITGAQRSYLENLATQAGETLDLDNMTKAQASIEINRLQGETGREGGADESLQSNS
jgi:hypothetical protein